MNAGQEKIPVSELEVDTPETITLPVQYDDASNEVMSPHYMRLRKLLAEHCRGPYSPEVDRFALFLRVDGDLCYWKREGCDGLRRSKVKRRMMIDIYVPRPRWEGVSGVEIRRYLIHWAEESLSRMVRKLQQDKAPVDGDALLRDFALVKERFIPQLATGSPSL